MKDLIYSSIAYFALFYASTMLLRSYFMEIYRQRNRKSSAKQLLFYLKLFSTKRILLSSFCFTGIAFLLNMF